MTRTDFEAALNADGFVEIETKTLPPRPANGEHGHHDDVRGMVINGVFTVIRGNKPVHDHPGDIFVVANGDLPCEAIGALDNVAGIAIWASVSTEVDARIRAQVKARVFPVKLKPEDWTSGSTDGGDHAPLGQEELLDVIAPSSISKSPKLASMVLASFSRLVKTGELNVHPVAARQVDADMLRKLAGDGAPEKST
jgi:hypothetical protein